VELTQRRKRKDQNLNNWQIQGKDQRRGEPTRKSDVWGTQPQLRRPKSKPETLSQNTHPSQNRGRVGHP
jgi:hypothetical protein